MEKSTSIVNIGKALLQFQQEVGKIYKKSENPFFKSKYADLSEILTEITDPLIKAGLVISQIPDGDGLTTIIIHVESGEYLQATSIMKPVKNDPQSVGSAITYQRRYSLGALLNLNIDKDDDGNKASTPPKTPEAPKTKEKNKVKDINALLLTFDNPFPQMIGKFEYKTKLDLFNEIVSSYDLSADEKTKLTQKLN